MPFCIAGSCSAANRARATYQSASMKEVSFSDETGGSHGSDGHCW